MEVSGVWELLDGSGRTEEGIDGSSKLAACTSNDESDVLAPIVT